MSAGFGGAREDSKSCGGVPAHQATGAPRHRGGAPDHHRAASSAARVPPWLTQAGRRLATKIDEWATRQLIGYLRENADEFRRICADRQDGVTLRVTISRIPGIDTLRAAARGQLSGQHQGWSFTGTPAVVIHAQPGHVIR